MTTCHPGIFRGLAMLVAILSTTLSTAALALTPAQQLVEKMGSSARSLTYKGYFTYDRGMHGSGYRIVHQAENGKERQRLVFLDGPAMEFINDGQTLKWLHAPMPVASPQNPVLAYPAASELDINPLEPALDSLESVWQNYTIAITGNGRVAGRPATRVELRPNDMHRYPFVFFVDDETGLMMKMLVLDAQGHVLERFHFVQIDIGSVSDADLAPALAGAVEEHAVPPTTPDMNSDAGWKVAWLPSGFREKKPLMKPLVLQSVGQQVYMFSDGLSAFSVFVEPAAEDVVTDTSTQVGSTSAISHVMKIRGVRFLVTVVGEIPIMTAKQIALSVEPSS